MVAPIVVYEPRLVFEAYNPTTGVLTGTPIELSDDVGSVEIGVDTGTNSVTTFTGKFQIPQTPEPSCEVHIVINADTSANWDALIGTFGQMRVYDRSASDAYRAFDTVIPLNPALYGETAPGEPRELDVTLPVLSEVTEGEDTP